MLPTIIIARSRCTLLLALVALLAAIVPIAGRADAQGTMNQLPDPIDSARLARSIERYVDVPADAWERIDEAHDAYLERFKALREGEIQRLMQEMMGMGGFMPEREAIEKMLDKFDAVEGRIASLDDRLFADVAAILGDEATTGVMRAKARRSRDRLGSGLTAQIGMGAYGVTVDLTDVVTEVEMSEAEEHRVDDALVGYERSLEARLRDVRDATRHTITRMFEAFEELGFGDFEDGEMPDPEVMQEMEVAMGRIFRDAAIPSQEAAKKVRELNDMTVSSLRGLLSEDAGWQLRRRAIEASYPYRFNTWIGAETTLRRFLALEDLPEAQRETISALQREWRRRDDAVVDQLVTTFDAMPGMDAFGMGDDDGERQRNEERIQELNTERSTIAEDVTARLAAIVEELPESLQQRAQIIAAGGDAAEQLAVVPVEIDPAGSDMASDGRPTGGADGMLAREITRGEFGVIRRSLNLADWQVPVAGTLYDDYVTAWGERVTPLAQRVREIQSRLYTWDEETGVGSMDRSQIPARYQAIRDAAAAIADVDGEFFDNLGGIADEAQAPTVQLARLEREVGRALLGDDGMLPSYGFDATSSSNVVFVARRAAGDDPALLAIVAEVARERGGELLSAARALRAVRLSTGERMEVFSAKWNERFQEEGNSVEYGQSWQEEVAVLGAELDPVRANLRSAENAMRDAVLARIDENQRDDYIAAWRRGRHPAIFDPRLGVFDGIDAALRLRDLEESQVAKLDALYAEYAEKWTAIGDRIVELNEGNNQMPDFEDPAAVQAWQEYTSRRGRLDFERRELRMRTLARLSRILTPEQRERIPMLRELDEGLENELPF